METIKNLSFNVVLLLIGAAFFVLGITGGFSAGSYRLDLSNSILRFVMSGTGALLFIAATVNEIRPRLSKKTSREATTRDVKPQNLAELTAQDFFHTLDDLPSKGFPYMVESAVRVSILGRTVVNLLSQYQKVFEELVNHGCEIRLLFVNPLSKACDFLYGSDLDTYKNNVATAVSHMNHMVQSAKKHLQIRIMDGAPTISLVIVDKQDAQSSFLQVQLYFLHGATGRNRPIFLVRRDDIWYTVFRDEFENLWTQAKDWDGAKYLQNIQQQG